MVHFLSPVIGSGVCSYGGAVFPHRYYLQKLTSSAVEGGSSSSLPPHPYHTSTVSYLPISAIDSERQSLSSEALTDDTHSVTDSSV